MLLNIILLQFALKNQHCYTRNESIKVHVLYKLHIRSYITRSSKLYFFHAIWQKEGTIRNNKVSGNILNIFIEFLYIKDTHKMPKTGSGMLFTIFLVRLIKLFRSEYSCQLL